MVHLIVRFYMDNCGNSRANTCVKRRTDVRRAFIRPKLTGFRVVTMVTLDKLADRTA